MWAELSVASTPANDGFPPLTKAALESTCPTKAMWKLLTVVDLPKSGGCEYDELSGEVPWAKTQFPKKQAPR